MIAGKLLGGLAGYFSFDILGAIVGLYIGHLFDQAFVRLRNSESPEVLQTIQNTFFNTTFTMIGYLAKADGRVSKEEIGETEQLMEKLGLTAVHKREAIKLFKMGADPDFKPQPILETFVTVCGHRVQLTQMLIIYLINTALADGDFDPKEVVALREIAQGLQFSSRAFEQLLKMVQAQGTFSDSAYQHRNEQFTPVDEIANAYAALGVTNSASNADIRKAYRKLMSEYHPDKLMGQGVPDDMIKVATERSQEVQAAYHLIKKTRKK